MAFANLIKSDLQICRGPILMEKYGPLKSPLKSPYINQEWICSTGEVKGLFKGPLKGPKFSIRIGSQENMWLGCVTRTLVRA